jgi:glutathione-regulated potassium-efflux system ancillary protein KefC
MPHSPTVLFYPTQAAPMETTTLNLAAVEIMDILPVLAAFALGFGARLVGLPPLVGFLAAGFVMGALGMQASDGLYEIADVGVTLLLFTIGLKLKIKQLLSPSVWATAGVHMALISGAAALLILLLGLTGLSLFAGLDPGTALLIGFALSFSSTVFAVKVLEENGEMESLHGRIAIGVLIMQDLFAVIFIAVSAGKLPSVWALGLLLLIPARPLLLKLLERTGHGEMMVLLGWLLPLGGAALFESVGVKADLGALLLGVLLAGHPKTDELAKALMGFKDLFLIGFFLTIGLTGTIGWEVLGLALVLMLLLPFKVALYFWLLAKFRLRARSATLASLGLANFSEFGLIVGAIGQSAGWLGGDWLTVIALALALSFALAAPLNKFGKQIYRHWHDELVAFESVDRLPGDDVIDPGNAQIVIFGMGRVGSAAYDFLHQRFGDVVLGIDRDNAAVELHRRHGRRVIQGDATDYDFWSRARTQGEVRHALLTFPDHTANLAAAQLFKEFGFQVTLASIAKFEDQVGELKAAGVHEVFNLYAEAGTGFAEHVWERLEGGNSA